MSNVLDNWYLEGVIDNNKSLIIPIDKNPFIIGRKDDCNLSLSSNDISRKHAEIFTLGQALMIRDLKSTNGTYLNNKKITQEKHIASGDTISLGNFRFRIFLKSYQDDNSETIQQLKIKGAKSDTFSGYYKLTKREEEILNYILEGKSTKKIAELLYISEGTAKNHVLNIFKKTDVHSRFELLTLYNKYNNK